jgi:type IV pilus assembly protein PilV
MRTARRGGFALPELLVALLVFSGGILALLHNQLLGARLAHEGLQRSLATALARDLVTRIQLNPAWSEGYAVEGPGDLPEEQRGPDVDCSAAHCSPGAWSSFESWQWRRLLRGRPVFLEGGDATDDGDRGMSALVAPAVCVARASGVVTVAVGWFAREAAHGAVAYRCRGGDIAGPDGAGRPPGLYSVKLHAWVGGEG